MSLFTPLTLAKSNVHQTSLVPDLSAHMAIPPKVKSQYEKSGSLGSSAVVENIRTVTEHVFRVCSNG